MIGTLLTFWFVRLVKKGKKLRNPKHHDQATFTSANNDDVNLIDPELFQLAKNYLEANLENDVPKSNQKKEILKNYLDSERKKMKEGLTYKQKKQMMIRRIRCTLVKHPYDHIGRQMAILAKNVWTKGVLHETKVALIYFRTLRKESAILGLSFSAWC